MYERVWEGKAPGLDGAEWDLSLDFNQETGLFRCSGALNGKTIESHECADPVIGGFMDEPGDQIVLDSSGMPLIPAAPPQDAGSIRPLLITGPDRLGHMAHPSRLARCAQGRDSQGPQHQDELHRIVG